MNTTSATSEFLSKPLTVSNNSNWRAYWQLFLVLTMPTSWSRWLLVIGFIILSLGSCVHFIFALTETKLPLLIDSIPTFVMLLGAVLCAVFPAMAIFILPSQILTLASSKVFALLTRLRLRLALILFIFLALLNAIFPVVALVTQHESFKTFEFFIISFTATSGIVLISIYVTRHFAMAQFFVGISFAVILPIFQSLKAIGIQYQLILLLAEWAVFLFWWTNWRPKKYHRSILIENMCNSSEAQQMHLNLWFMQFTLSKKANSFFGTRFLGRSDSAVNSFYTSFVGFSLGIAILLLTFLILFKIQPRNAGTFLDTNGNMVFIYAMIVAYTYGAQLTAAQLVNFKKTWLCFMGRRRELFRRVENLCVEQYLLQFSAVAIPVALFLLIFPPLRSIAIPIFLGLGLGFIQSLFHIYLNLWMYQKFRAQRSWIMGINIGVTLLTYAPCAVLAVFPDFVKTHWEIFSAIFAGYLGLIILLRQIAKRSWTHIEFYEAQ